MLKQKIVDLINKLVEIAFRPIGNPVHIHKMAANYELVYHTNQYIVTQSSCRVWNLHFDGTAEDFVDVFNKVQYQVCLEFAEELAEKYGLKLETDLINKPNVVKLDGSEVILSNFSILYKETKLKYD